MFDIKNSFKNLNNCNSSLLPQNAFFVKSGDHVTLTDLSTTLIIIWWSFAFVFFYSELGERVTLQFNVFYELLCQGKWYLFSIDVQKMLIIFMMDAEQPAIIQGYANVQCTRDSFKNVRSLRGNSFNLHLIQFSKALGHIRIIIHWFFPFYCRL